MAGCRQPRRAVGNARCPAEHPTCSSSSVSLTPRAFATIHPGGSGLSAASQLHEALPTLYSAIKQQDEAQAAAFTENGHWKTIMMIASEAGGGDVAAGGPGPAAAAEPTWACKHCTIVNQQSAPSCSMCGLPR